MASASPYRLCVVGRPRRKSSSSIAGRSSWIREYVCISSMAAALGNTWPGSAPKTAAVSMHSVGLTLFPPPSIE
jgi:hypothetical protein